MTQLQGVCSPKVSDQVRTALVRKATSFIQHSYFCVLVNNEDLFVCLG